MSSRGDLKICIHSYRNLLGVEFSPRGLCALTGPSGSGKTSLMSVIAECAEMAASPIGAQHRREAKMENRSVSIESSSWTWSSSIMPSNKISHDGTWLPELVTIGGERFSTSALMDPSWKRNSILRNPELFAVLQQVSDIGSLTLGRSPLALDELVADGRRITSQGKLLLHWQAFRHLHRHRWVIDSIRVPFPDVCYLDVDKNDDVLVVREDGKRSTPLREEPSAFRRVLDILFAVGRMNDGDTMFLEEIERHLDPVRLSMVLELLRNKADRDASNIIVETQSKRVISFFQEDLDSVFVMNGGFLAALSALVDPSWAATFPIGNLYGSAFGRVGLLDSKRGDEVRDVE
jgi:energy-coupling factor transporter ATP-binding protein EcfA2